jgi:hypothetical protein
MEVVRLHDRRESRYAWFGGQPSGRKVRSQQSAISTSVVRPISVALSGKEARAAKAFRRCLGGRMGAWTIQSLALLQTPLGGRSSARSNTVSSRQEESSGVVVKRSRSVAKLSGLAVSPFYPGGGPGAIDVRYPAHLGPNSEATTLPRWANFGLSRRLAAFRRASLILATGHLYRAVDKGHNF